MPHYNSTNEEGEQLEQYNKQTATQDNRIANFFEATPGELWTPWAIQSMVFTHPRPPITSVRRSMNDLTKAHILTKTEVKKEAGPYGRRSYLWTLNEKYNNTKDALDHIFGDIKAITDDFEIKHPEVVQSTHEEIKSQDEAKTSPQGKLFDVPPIKEPPVHCAICNRELTNPDSIAKGIGPVCAKCQKG